MPTLVEEPVLEPQPPMPDPEPTHESLDDLLRQKTLVLGEDEPSGVSADSSKNPEPKVERHDGPEPESNQSHENPAPKMMEETWLQKVWPVRCFLRFAVVHHVYPLLAV